jgi:protein-S-isoprenylcysteine O-methyltransferase Ste14
VKAVEPAGWPLVLAGATGQLLLLCAPLVLAGGPRPAMPEGRVMLFLAIATAWCVAEAAVQPLRDSASDGERGWLQPAMGIAVIVVFWISLLEGMGDRRVATGMYALPGAAAMTAGIALRLVAIRTLGRFFLDEIAVAPRQALVTHGIYGRVRHPSEAGTLLLVFGGALLLGSGPGSVLAAVTVLPAVLWRIRLENGLLARSFPTSFRDYARATPNLLPLPRWET